MVLLVLQEIMIATVFLDLGILVPKEREPGNEVEGSVSQKPQKSQKSQKRYKSKAKYGNQSKLKSAGPKRQTSPNVL